jgi:hypothetical protein
MSEPLSSIATDTASPHYGHGVVDLDEGRWRCATCDPLGALEDVVDAIELRTATLLIVIREAQAMVARVQRELQP